MLRESGILRVEELAVAGAPPHHGAAARRGVKLLFERRAERQVVDRERDGHLHRGIGGGPPGQRKQREEHCEKWREPNHRSMIASACQQLQWAAQRIPARLKTAWWNELP